MIDKLIDSLCNQVSACFGVPGSGHSSQIITGLMDSGIPFYSTNHEASAAIMAGIFGEVGGISSCISIKGPGLSNMFPGLANNHFEDRAVISLSENFDDGALKWHKRLDHSFVFQVAKYVGSLTTMDDNLASIACEGRPGVVHVELCNQDISYRQSFQPTRHDVPKIGDQPVIILGKKCSGNNFDDLKSPVFTTASAKGLVDENSPNSFGVYCGVGYNENIIESADTLIAVEVSDYEVLKIDPRLSHLSYDQFNTIRSQLKVWNHNACLADKRGWNPPFCFGLMNNTDWDYSMVVDTGLYCVAAEYYWKASPSRRFLGSLNSRFMGTALPTAIGAALADDVPIVCCFGDGGLSYISELTMVQKYQLPIYFIGFIDGKYSSLGKNSRVGHKDYSWLRVFDGLGIESSECRDIDSFWSQFNSWDFRPKYIECIFDQESYINSICDLRA